MNFSQHNKVIKGIAFEKAILEILKKDNPDLRSEYRMKDTMFDAYIEREINLSCFGFRKINYPHIYIEIRAGRLEGNKIKWIAQNFNEVLKNEDNCIILFFSGEKPKYLLQNFENKSNFIIIDKTRLAKNSIINKVLNSFDTYLLEKDNILIENNYIELEKLNSNLSFALGAGCSTNSNISDWNRLSEALGFELLYNVVGERDSIYKNMFITNELSKRIFDCYDKTSALDAIYNSYISSPSVSKLEYFDSIKKVLYMSFDNPNDANKPLLTSINNCIKRKNIKEIITYNFDSVLEQNYDNTYNSSTKEILDSETHIGNCKVNHVHGFIPYDYDAKTPVNNFVFTDKEYYDNMVDPNTFCNRKQREIINKYNVIFVGVSFTDANMKQHLRERKENENTNKIFGFLRLPNFDGKDKDVLLMINKYKLIQQNYFNSLGVKILWVNDYSEIPNCIDRI